MAAYIVADVDVLDPAVYERYKGLAPPAIAAHGGKYLARGGRTEVLEGSWTPRRAVILEFESLEKAKAWYTSVEYAEARKLRQDSSRTNMIVIDGLPPG